MTAPALGRPIAVGRTAEIYAWGDGQVLKLFRPGWSAEVARDEAAIARAAHAAGVPTPAVDDVIEVDGRVGIVFERVRGPSMLKALVAAPWRLRSFASRLAELHARVHREDGTGLPSLKERLAGRVRAAGLPGDLEAAVLARLDALPDGTAACHGDLHPDNVIVSSHGPVIIDWLDAAAGPPLADVARTSLVLTSGALPPETPCAGPFTGPFSSGTAGWPGATRPTSDGGRRLSPQPA